MDRSRIKLDRRQLLSAKNAWSVEFLNGRTEETFGQWLLARYAASVDVQWPELAREENPARAYCLVLEEVTKH